MNYDGDFLLDRDVNWFVDDSHEISSLHKDGLLANDYSGIFDNHETDQAMKVKQTASCRPVTPSSPRPTAFVSTEFLPSLADAQVFSHNHDTMSQGLFLSCHISIQTIHELYLFSTKSYCPEGDGDDAHCDSDRTSQNK